MKNVRIADLPWEERKSPGGKYHSFFKDISLALGGIRDTGPWGGGHPFDLQLRRVPPGAAVGPLHAHTVQWELFVVLGGTATVRIDNETHPVKAGDAFLQPPGTAHQILKPARRISCSTSLPTIRRPTARGIRIQKNGR
jgi:uncharacterized cupin superfamily protein